MLLVVVNSKRSRAQDLSVRYWTIKLTCLNLDPSWQIHTSWCWLVKLSTDTGTKWTLKSSKASSRHLTCCTTLPLALNLSTQRWLMMVLSWSEWIVVVLAIQLGATYPSFTLITPLYQCMKVTTQSWPSKLSATSKRKSPLLPLVNQLTVFSPTWTTSKNFAIWSPQYKQSKSSLHFSTLTLPLQSELLTLFVTSSKSLPRKTSRKRSRSMISTPKISSLCPKLITCTCRTCSTSNRFKNTNSKTARSSLFSSCSARSSV